MYTCIHVYFLVGGFCIPDITRFLLSEPGFARLADLQDYPYPMRILTILVIL